MHESMYVCKCPCIHVLASTWDYANAYDLHVDSHVQVHVHMYVVALILVAFHICCSMHYVARMCSSVVICVHALVGSPLIHMFAMPCKWLCECVYVCARACSLSLSSRTTGPIRMGVAIRRPPSARKSAAACLCTFLLPCQVLFIMFSCPSVCSLSVFLSVHPSVCKSICLCLCVCACVPARVREGKHVLSCVKV